MEQQEKLQLSEYQKAELENTFRLFNPNSEGKIHISQLSNLLDLLETGLDAQTERKPHRQQSLSESSSPLTQPSSPLNPRYEPRVSVSSFPSGSEECDFETFLRIIEDNISSDHVGASLTHTFQLMDLRKIGKIEAKDLKTVAELLGEPIESEGEAQRLLNLMTVMEANSANFEEFQSYFMKTLKPERSP
jgi:Ca2+-binding EF-hand superfamily protein